MEYTGQTLMKISVHRDFYRVPPPLGEEQRQHRKDNPSNTKPCNRIPPFTIMSYPLSSPKADTLNTERFQPFLFKTCASHLFLLPIAHSLSPVF
jgi:hypothetical protein